MSRLSIVLSAVALVLAALAFAYPYVRGQEPQIETAAIEQSVRQVLESNPDLVAPPAPAAEAQVADAEVVELADPEVIGPAVRQYLLANPEVLEEVITALETKREEAQASAQADAVASNRDDLVTPEFETPVGNPNGDVTLVEFFDYNCGYCKRMLPQIVDLIETDENLRVVFKEWPVLGEDSQEAARVALGVRQVAPDKYFEFHRTLLSQRGRVGRDQAMAVAEELGIDTDAVAERAAGDATAAALQESFRLGDALGLRGTPSYVVGDRVFMGAVPREDLESQIAQVRGNECIDC